MKKVKLGTKVTLNIPPHKSPPIGLPKKEPIIPITTNETEINIEFRICPDCQVKSLKTENGCDMCMECGYSKCDK